METKPRGPLLTSASDAWRWVNDTLILYLDKLQCKWLTADGPRERHDDFARLTLAVIKGASIVLWRDDLRRAAFGGQELFKDTPFDPSILRFQPQLWVYDRDINIDNAMFRIPRWYCLGATLLCNTLPGMLMGHGMVMCHFLLPYESDLPRNPTIDDVKPIVVINFVEDGQKPREQDGLGGFMGMLNFMNLDIVDVKQDRLPRPFRRRIQRNKGTEPDIRVVTLRRIHHGGSSHHSDIEWTCQWVVKGHWRKQWYPSKQEHYPVFVLPYIKGPEGKPLKVETTTVFDVRR